MNENGLIFAFIFDGKGGGKQISWDEINTWTPEQGVLWVHCDYSSEYVQQWMINESQLDPIIAESLLSEETRPRAAYIGQNVLLALRGVNLYPGSDPHDMVAIRVWSEKNRIISSRKRKLMSVIDIATALSEHRGPKTTGEFISSLCSGLTIRMESVVDQLEDQALQLEDDVITLGSNTLRNELGAVRRESIVLRRYFAPQREAMLRLSSEKTDWISEHDRLSIRESTDQLVRYIEDLDSVRDRASVTQEELANKLTEQMNTRMYVLSMISAVFLPLGFLTGLLGVNVGGIPGSENSAGFFIFVLFIAFVTLIQIFIFKKKKWL